jgi:hypothetical protein
MQTYAFNTECVHRSCMLFTFSPLLAGAGAMIDRDFAASYCLGNINKSFTSGISSESLNEGDHSEYFEGEQPDIHISAC